MRKTVLKIALFLLCALLLAAVLVLRKESAGRQISKPIANGNIVVPNERTYAYNPTSELKEKVIAYWANGEAGAWKDGEKVGVKNARVVLGSLVAGKRIAEMNQYILSQKATGTGGSRWLLNPKGGYNFTTMAFTPILYLFEDKPHLLFPETKAHLAKNILTIKGSGFTKRVPWLPIQDSENHILMSESSRYLKNQWLKKEGNPLPEFDNKANGVEAKLIAFLEEIFNHGIYEFNSSPYLGYTYCSLLNLYEFAECEKIKELSMKILDRMNWQYALASYQFKHFPPYRRKFGKSFKNNLDSDYHTVMLKIWASLYNNQLQATISRGEHHALWAAVMSYRPPDKVMKWVLEKPGPYFVKMGFGHNSCPGIYAGNKDYLISGGGANQGKNSLIVAKPITLFLNDDASDLSETFHMYGPGNKMAKWNNSGVYEDFACTSGEIHIPPGKEISIKKGNWNVYSISTGTYLVFYSQKELGIMVIVNADSAKNAWSKVYKNNPNELLLKTQFKHPNGKLIEYDLDAPKSKWVIRKINGKPVHRDFEGWTFFDGCIKSICQN